jgi:hypothetical protein
MTCGVIRDAPRTAPAPPRRSHIGEGNQGHVRLPGGGSGDGSRLYRESRLPLDGQISLRIRLPWMNEAFDAMRAGGRTRSVILFD